MIEDYIAYSKSNKTRGKIKQTLRNIIPQLRGTMFTPYDLNAALVALPAFKDSEDLKETIRRTLWCLRDEGIVEKTKLRNTWRAAK